MENKRIKKLIKFLQMKFPHGVQMFNTRNTVGDPMVTIYIEDDITVDYCEFYSYIEIFGLTREELETVVKTCADDFTKEFTTFHTK